MALFILELVNIDDNLVLEVILDILRCHGFDDRWLGLASFPGTIVLEVHLVKVDEVPPAQVVASVREGLAEENRGRWKSLASNQAEAFLSAESQLIKFVLLISGSYHKSTDTTLALKLEIFQGILLSREHS